MRKIPVGVLSVAGLFAAVLALASGPVAAATDVVTITSDTDVGTYVVTWSTGGGCDPGDDTSGASGEVTLTVVEGDTAGEGAAAQTGVVLDTICTYEWKAVLVQADGSRCRAAIAIADSATTLETGDCNSVEKVTFTVAGYTTPAGGDKAAVPPTAAVLGADVRFGTTPLFAAHAFAWLAETLFADPPLTRDMLGVLEQDDAIDPEPARAMLGIELTSLDAALRAAFAEESAP